MPIESDNNAILSVPSPAAPSELELLDTLAEAAGEFDQLADSERPAWRLVNLETARQLRWLASALPALLAAQRDRSQLLRFAGAALTEVRIVELGDWDGGSIQDAMESCGLIECVQRAVPCGEGCRCADDYDSGETASCFLISALGHEAVKAFRDWQDATHVAARAAGGE